MSACDQCTLWIARSADAANIFCFINYDLVREFYRQAVYEINYCCIECNELENSGSKFDYYIAVFNENKNILCKKNSYLACSSNHQCRCQSPCCGMERLSLCLTFFYIAQTSRQKMALNLAFPKDPLHCQ